MLDSPACKAKASDRHGSIVDENVNSYRLDVHGGSTLSPLMTSTADQSPGEVLLDVLEFVLQLT